MEKSRRRTDASGSAGGAEDAVGAELDRRMALVIPPLMSVCRLSMELLVALRVLARYAAEIGQAEGENAVLRHLDRGHSRAAVLRRTERLLSLAVETSPGDFRGHFWLGMLHLENGDSERALTCFEAAATWFSGATLAFHYAAEIGAGRRPSERIEAYALAALGGWRRFKPSIPRLLASDAIDARLAARLASVALGFNPAWLYGGAFYDAVEEAAAKKADLLEADGVTPRVDAMTHALETMLDEAAERASFSKEKDDTHVLIENHFGYTLFRAGDRFYGLPVSVAHQSEILFRRIDRGVRGARGDRRLYRADTFSALEATIREDAIRPGRVAETTPGLASC